MDIYLIFLFTVNLKLCENKTNNTKVNSTKQIYTKKLENQFIILLEYRLIISYIYANNYI